MRPAEVILLLYFTQKHSHRETEVKQGLSTMQQVEVQEIRQEAGREKTTMERSIC